jgi:microcystin-dependent protein
VAWPTSTAPAGWLLLNGTTANRTTYADLFAVIGTTYGNGDGFSTFGLPDLRGRVLVTRDSGDTDFDALGETGGSKTHTLTESEIPSHTHAISANQSATTTATGSQNRLTALSAGTTGNDDATSAATGGGGAHNNVQPYMVLNHIIKT